MSVASIVEGLIAENAVMVFSKSGCPFCVKAKRLLSSLGAQFQALELDEIDNGSEIQSYLAKKTSQRTVPNIFIKQAFIGGCDTLHAKHASGELKELLGL